MALIERPSNINPLSKWLIIGALLFLGFSLWTRFQLEDRLKGFFNSADNDSIEEEITETFTENIQTEIEEDNTTKEDQSTTSEDSPIPDSVEEMPRFPGCEGIIDNQEKTNCSNKKLMEYIYQHIKYPAIARENGIEGTVFISFVVEKNGDISQAKIIRDIGAGCGREALRVVNEMKKNGIKWIPGFQGGRKVKTQFNLPIHYKLE